MHSILVEKYIMDKLQERESSFSSNECLEMGVIKRIFFESKDKKKEIHINHRDRSHLDIVNNNFKVLMAVRL